jgi:hypothetical protein
MYFYTVREVLPTLAILGASFILLGGLAMAAFALWKAARQFGQDARRAAEPLRAWRHAAMRTLRGQSLTSVLQPVAVVPAVPSQRCESSGEKGRTEPWL